MAETGEIQLVVFQLGREEYGVPILKVQEINRLAEITQVPRSAKYVEGVMNLRGRVTPVFDLKKKFGLSGERGAEARIIVVNTRGQTVGLIVDAVNEVIRLPLSSVEPPPAVFSADQASFLQGVGKVDDRLLILLELDKVLSQEEREALAELECA